MTVKEIRSSLNKTYPEELAMDFDNSGFLVGDQTAEVTGVLVCLDITHRVIEEAVALGYNTIISHHPVIFYPLKQLYKDDIAYKLVQNNLHAICYHTNLDIALGGVNDCLAKMLGLRDIKTPVLGEDTHPPVRVGHIDPCSGVKFIEFAKGKLACKSARVSSFNKTVTTVAVCGGAGNAYIYSLAEMDIDLFITSQIKHEAFLYAKHKGLMVADLGHFETEQVVLPILVQAIKNEFHALTIEVSQKEENPVWYI